MQAQHAPYLGWYEHTEQDGQKIRHLYIGAYDAGDDHLVSQCDYAYTRIPNPKRMDRDDAHEANCSICLSMLHNELEGWADNHYWRPEGPKQKKEPKPQEPDISASQLTLFD